MKNKVDIKSTIMSRFFKKMLRAGVIYIVVLIAGLFLAKSILTSRIWHEWDAFYWQLHWIHNNQGICVLILFLTGLLILGVFYWIRLLNYFQEVIEAMEQIPDAENLIHLRKDLTEVEYYMNQIKGDIRRNEQLAREAEQRKNDLVVYLAHDLKTPLTSVIGYLTLLTEERQISPELQEKYLSISLKKAQRLEELINEFFEITRFNLTQMELKKSAVSLKMMLEQIVYEFQPMLEEKQLSCKLSVEPIDMKILCDADKMQRVFDNLLRNAVFYCYEKSVIQISAEKQNGKIKIQIENSGMEIPKEKLERIFEQFFRVDSARSSRGGGAGLGLAIAKEIVELHQGKIWAESQQGKTCFFIEFIV